VDYNLTHHGIDNDSTMAFMTIELCVGIPTGRGEKKYIYEAIKGFQPILKLLKVYMD